MDLTKIPPPSKEANACMLESLPWIDKERILVEQKKKKTGRLKRFRKWLSRKRKGFNGINSNSYLFTIST